MNFCLSALLLLCLLYPAQSRSQSKPHLIDRGNFGLHVVPEGIWWDRYLESQNQLLLLGPTTLQRLDLSSRTVIETRRITLPSQVGKAYPGVKVSGALDPREEWKISPNGRRMLIVRHPEAKIGKNQTAWIWDLEKGERIAVLDPTPTGVHCGFWSKNGKTLVTFDQDFVDYFTTKLAVSFWDGETFEYRKTISVDNVTWLHLSDDGQRFFAASGKKQRKLGVKYVSDSDAVINVWFTRTAELEKTIAVGDRNFSPKTREIEFSPDDKFLLLVNRHQSKSGESKLLAWEMNGSVQPAYEVKPQPKIDDARIEFSRDGKLFVLDVGKGVQVYETKTGHLIREVPDVELPGQWLSNDLFFTVEHKSKNFFDMGQQLKTFDAHDGTLLYKQRLAYEEGPVYFILGLEIGSPVVDSTSVLPHPTRDLFVTQSNEHVKLFDSRTGALLQTVVSPLVGIDKNGRPKPTHGKTVNKAHWTADGKTLCVFSANGQSVSLWELSDN